MVTISKTVESDFNELITFLSNRLNLKNAILRKLINGRLVTVSAFGYGQEETEIDILLGHGITGQTALIGESICINDLENYKGEYIPGITGAKSELCIPLINNRGMVIGTLNMESKVRHNFTENKIDLLEMMSKKYISSVEEWKEPE